MVSKHCSKCPSTQLASFACICLSCDCKGPVIRKEITRTEKSGWTLVTWWRACLHGKAKGTVGQKAALKGRWLLIRLIFHHKFHGTMLHITEQNNFRISWCAQLYLSNLTFGHVTCPNFIKNGSEWICLTFDSVTCLNKNDSKVNTMISLTLISWPGETNLIKNGPCNEEALVFRIV